MGNNAAGDSHSNTWLSRLGAPHPPASSPLGLVSSSAAGGGGMCGGGGGVGSAAQLAPASTSELHLEGLSAGEALQQMSVLVSSYMDTLQVGRSSVRSKRLASPVTA